MRDWMDLNGDGEIDGAERMFANEMLCDSREEHVALCGDAGDFGNRDKEDDLEYDAAIAGLDVDVQEFMDANKRRETLEDAGLDPGGYDFG